MKGILELIAVIIVGILNTILIAICVLFTIVFSIVGVIMEYAAEGAGMAVDWLADFGNLVMDRLNGKPREIEDL